MELGERGGYAIEVGSACGAVRQSSIEHLVVWQAPHHHDAFVGIAGEIAHRAELEGAAPTSYQRDAAVRGRREPAVELDLRETAMQTSLAGRIVEKRETNRLLRLVDEISGEKDPGNVRLALFDRRRTVGIERRVAERSHERVVARDLRHPYFSWSARRWSINTRDCRKPVYRVYSWLLRASSNTSPHTGISRGPCSAT
jgi:hypothetical protein